MFCFSQFASVDLFLYLCICLFVPLVAFATLAAISSCQICFFVFLSHPRDSYSLPVSADRSNFCLSFCVMCMRLPVFLPAETSLRLYLSVSVCLSISVCQCLCQSMSVSLIFYARLILTLLFPPVLLTYIHASCLPV